MALSDPKWSGEDLFPTLCRVISVIRADTLRFWGKIKGMDPSTAVS